MIRSLDIRRLAGLMLALLLMAGLARAQDLAPDSTTRAGLIVLPFRNLGVDPDAKTDVMPMVYRQLQGGIFQALPSEEVLKTLRAVRLRDTGQINSRDADTISQRLGTPWILLGSVDFFDSSQVEVGVSARLLNSLTGEIIWADGAYTSGAEHTGLLGIGEIRSSDRLADQLIQRLFASLDQFARKNPGRIYDPGNGNRNQPSIILIPFDCASQEQFAGQILSNILLSGLIQRGYRIVEPGVINDLIMTGELAPKGQVDLATMKAMANAFSADFCLTGYLEKLGNQPTPNSDTNPVLEIEARLVETGTGKLVWAKHVAKSGNGRIGLLHTSKVYSLGRLMKKASGELLDDLSREVQPGGSNWTGISP